MMNLRMSGGDNEPSWVQSRGRPQTLARPEKALWSGQTDRDGDNGKRQRGDTSQ